MSVENSRSRGWRPEHSTQQRTQQTFSSFPESLYLYLRFIIPKQSVGTLKERCSEFIILGYPAEKKNAVLISDWENTDTLSNDEQTCRTYTFCVRERELAIMQRLTLVWSHKKMKWGVTRCGYPRWKLRISWPKINCRTHHYVPAKCLLRSMFLMRKSLFSEVNWQSSHWKTGQELASASDVQMIPHERKLPVENAILQKFLVRIEEL